VVDSDVPLPLSVGWQFGLVGGEPGGVSELIREGYSRAHDFGLDLRFVGSVLQSGRLASGAPPFSSPSSEPSDEIAMAPSEPTHRTRLPVFCFEGVEPKAKRDLVMSYVAPDSGAFEGQLATASSLPDVPPSDSPLAVDELIPLAPLAAPAVVSPLAPEPPLSLAAPDFTSLRLQQPAKSITAQNADRGMATPTRKAYRMPPWAPRNPPTFPDG
jgi:hypothetical protein